MPESLHDLTLTEASDLLHRREASSVDLTQAAFERIRALDDRIHAFLTLTEDRALEQARAAPTPAARSGSRRHSPASLASNRRTGESRATDWWRLPRPSTRSGRSRAPSATRRLSLRRSPATMPATQRLRRWSCRKSASRSLRQT